jgi:hypothetical protein
MKKIQGAGMKIRASEVFCLAGLCLAVAGCSSDLLFTFSVEDKINTSIPASSVVLISKAALLEQVNGSQKKEIESEYAARMKLRALTCGKGASLSMFASKEAIRNQIGNPGCFVTYDTDMERWLGLRRIGIIAAKPPLRTVPLKAPAFILSDAFIQSVRFSDKAGVALLETQKSIQIVDIETSKVIYQEPKTSSQIGQLSENGRLFTLKADARIKVRDAESGAVLLELPGVTTFHWLDASSALYTKSDGSGKPTIVDFTSGRDGEAKGLQAAITNVSKVQGHQNQFIVGSYRSVSKVELVRTGIDLDLKLINEKPINGGSWATNTSGLNADGKLFFDSNPNLSLLNLETLEQEVILFEPFRLQTAVATPDPNQILLTGFGSGSGPATYLYSLTDKSMSKVDKTKLLSERLLYISFLKKQAVIADSKIAILDNLPLEPAVELTKFIGVALEQANLRKMEQARQIEMEQALMSSQSSLQQSGRAPAAGTYSAPSFDSAYRNPAAPMATAPGILAKLAKNAQIEAIGVYQGTSSNRGGNRAGDVEVRVRKSAKPIVLVLSSYEPIRWRIVVESGAQLNGVLVSGYYQSQVLGAGSARVLMSGNQYAYKEGTVEFMALNRNVMQQLGKPIYAFQGKYEGSSFKVGG